MPTSSPNFPPTYDLRWMHKPRGGYGYVIPVPCRRIRETASRMLIAALRQDGSEVERWVSRDSVRGQVAP